MRNDWIIIWYVDDFCIFFKDKEKIDSVLKNLLNTSKLADEEGVNYYLGMNVRKDPNGTITMIQPEIIDKIINSLGICDESKMHDAPKNVILKKDEDWNVNGSKQEWHYRSVNVQMNYIAGATITNILFVVHQCKKYSMDPKKIPWRICQKYWTIFKYNKR